jgi:hypothetical protein
MKLRAHTIPIVCIMIGLASLIMGGSANAQMIPQPPMLAPYNPSMNMGLFYLSAGVKYRNIQTVRFEIVPHATSRIINQGSPPWGPNEDGFVFYPYNELAALPEDGRQVQAPFDPDPAASDDAFWVINPLPVPSNDPATNGTWTYDNGEINPMTPMVNPVDIGNWTDGDPYDIAFFPPERRLGWSNGSQLSSGSFLINDPAVQANGTRYDNTSRINYSRLLDGRLAAYETASLGYQGNFSNDAQIEFTNKILTPYFEAGYRVSNFFNILFGFSWFNIKETYQTSLSGTGYVIRRTFTDSVFFRSSDPETWITTGFTSAFTADSSGGGTPDPSQYYYLLYPAGTGANVNLPVRTFTQTIDASIQPFGVQETLFNKLDFTALEFKAGSRSWFPLYGLGQIGTSLGVLWTPMPYTITTSRVMTASETSAAAGVTAGQTLMTISNKQSDVWLWPNVGLFVGGDLRLGSGRWFLQSNVEYDIYFGEGCSYGDIVRNVVNLSGVNATLTAGSYF